jgi:ElaB/YqjD/DUF883 family membrane-anchored ribosome-binding protein
MGQDPDTIRNEVEQTREQMGETIDALGHKADVKGRARERVGRVTGRVSDAAPDAEQVKQGARRAAGVAQENPLGLAVGAMALGFLAGMLIPSSRVEDEQLGPMADQVKQQAKETGQQVASQARESAGSIGR